MHYISNKIFILACQKQDSLHYGLNKVIDMLFFQTTHYSLQNLAQPGG
uniref:Uncharacterized protein n=1 Tax=viral metagenome TaxID=1070528 RepID=A0A6C0DML8_9ZZZZ